MQTVEGLGACVGHEDGARPIVHCPCRRPSHPLQPHQQCNHATHLHARAQVLYGSYPIAHCRDPYAVIRYLAQHMWPRLHTVLGLKHLDEEGRIRPPHLAAAEGDPADDDEASWTPLGG